MADPLDVSPAGRPRATRVAWTLIAVGVALRTWQWLAGASLWLDEIVLARNVIELPLGALLAEPLAFDQVAPRGFLVLTKLSVWAFGEGERALRLPALLVSIAGVPLFWSLARRLLSERAALVSLALFALAVPLIHYAAEVKQYGLDATASVLVLLVAMRLEARAPTRREAWEAALIGFATVWFAQAAVLVLAGCGAALVLNAWLRDGPRARHDGAIRITVPVWAFGALLALLAGKASMTPATAAFMQDFWQLGFAPPITEPLAWSRWVARTWLALFEDAWLLRVRWGAIVATVAALGIIALWRRGRTRALFATAPLVVAFAAAAAHQYPLVGRPAVYLMPFIVLLLAAGAEGIGELLARRERKPVFVWAALALTFVPIGEALWRTGVPLVVEDARPQFAYLQANRRPGDAIWMPLIGASQARHYGSRFGLARADYEISSCDLVSPKSMLRDFEKYRGRSRVWVMTTGQLRLQAYQAPVRNYLAAIGVRRDTLYTLSDIFLPYRLELYDLSDTTRLNAAAAETFEFAPVPTDRRTGCRDWSGPVR